MFDIQVSFCKVLDEMARQQVIALWQLLKHAERSTN